MIPKLKYTDREVFEPGCPNCVDMLSYTVVTAEDGWVLGAVFMVRMTEGHPEGPHFGKDWKGVLPDGTAVTGNYSIYQGFHEDGGTRFITRARAGEHLYTAMNARAGTSRGAPATGR